MSEKIKERTVFLLWKTDLAATRFTLAIAACLWGVLLLWQGDTFTRPTYHVMSAIATENVWGFAFLLQGVCALVSLFKSCCTKHIFLVDAVLGCVLWSIACVSMLMAVSPPPAAISGEIALACAAWWVLVRYKLGETC